MTFGGGVFRVRCESDEQFARCAMKARCPQCSSEFETPNEFGGIAACPSCKKIFDAKPVPPTKPLVQVVQAIVAPPVNRGTVAVFQSVPSTVTIVLPANALLSYQPKSRVAYVLLGLFLGGLGIHNFYAGHTNNAIMQLLLSLFGALLCFVPNLVVAIWALVEVCTVTSDGNGVSFT